MTLGRGDFGALNLALMLGALLLAAGLFIRYAGAPRRVAAVGADDVPPSGPDGGGWRPALVMTVMTATLVVGQRDLARALGLLPRRWGCDTSAGRRWRS